MTNNQKVIHKYKYLTLKTLTINEDINFNKICLTEDITPNYVNLRTNSKSISAVKTLQTARKIWIKEEIKHLYIKLEDIKRQRSEIYDSLISQFHQESITEIKNYINNWIAPILKKKKETHSKKLNKLFKIQKHDQNIINPEETPNFYPKLQNLTSIEFNTEETNFLEKALKYNINLDYKQSTIEDELINVDMAIKSTEKESQEPLRHIFIHELDKTNLKFNNQSIIKSSKQEMQIIKNISTKLKENKAIITKADKGNTSVIIKKEEYDNKVEEFIHNNNLKNLEKDPTQEFSKLTKQF